MTLRSYRVPIYGFDTAQVLAESESKARYRAFRLAQDAGWFLGRDGFWRFLVESGRPVPAAGR